MYELIWRLLPGPTWLKAVEALVLLLAVVYALMEHVFPWADGIWHFSGEASVG